MTELFLLLLCLVAETTFGDGSDPSVVPVEEGSDATLPCSLSSKENIESDVFDWRTGRKEVFRYEEGLHDDNGLLGQDEQFKGRVSHFPGELKTGNASIIIRNVKKTDGGDYSCEFTQRGEKRVVQLVVVVSSRKPDVSIVSVTEDGVLLQCEVRGASPKPNLKWQNSSGHVLPNKEPKVIRRGGSYDVLLRTTVTTTDTYRCVATQESISHRDHTDTYVFIRGAGKEQLLTSILISVGTTFLVSLLLCCCSCFCFYYRRAVG